uniref:Reverse transcriptase zinc-binding domain-containing protein n=1 Tax=Oryza brachyantha TaxID=4533 RepID=J3N9Y1_ORYBR
MASSSSSGSRPSAGCCPSVLLRKLEGHGRREIPVAGVEDVPLHGEQEHALRGKESVRQQQAGGHRRRRPDGGADGGDKAPRRRVRARGVARRAGNAWMRCMGQNFSPERVQDFLRIWERMSEADTQLTTGNNDCIEWKVANSGEYTAKSAYVAQFAGRTRSHEADLIWNTWAPSKCKIMVWLLLKNKIWTADRLQVRGWPNEYFCQLYYRNLETPRHLFKDCLVTKQIWEELKISGITTAFYHDFFESDSVVVWLDKVISCTDRKSAKWTKSLAMLVIWQIWCERNHRVFQRKELSLQQILTRIKDEIGIWKACGAKFL